MSSGCDSAEGILHINYHENMPFCLSFYIWGYLSAWVQNTFPRKSGIQHNIFLKLGWLRIFCRLPKGIIGVVEKSLNWCSKYKSCVVVYTLTIKCTRFLAASHACLVRFFLPINAQNNLLSFIRSRKKKYSLGKLWTIRSLHYSTMLIWG